MFQKTFLTIAILTILILIGAGSSCQRNNQSGAVTIANSEAVKSLDSLTAGTSLAADERLRSLLHNTLVKKNEKFEYVGDLAKEIKIGDDKLTITFELLENVKFHNGAVFSSKDAKYTLETLMKSDGYKAANLFDVTPNPQDEKNPTKDPRLTIDAPDAKTLVIKVKRPSLVNQILADLVAIPMIPDGSIEQQKTAPVGSGPFKFVAFDQVNGFVQMAAHQEYFGGAAKFPLLNLKTVPDASALAAELQTGRVDLAPNPTNISADTLNAMSQNSALQVVQSEGSNIRYIGFNVSNKALENVKFRQAIAFAIDREKIIKELLNGKGKIAHSILPESSWAYSAEVKYSYNPEKAKQLVKESGYNGEVVKLTIPADAQAVNLYAQFIQNSLKEVGINLELEPVNNQVLLEQLAKGQFQMNTSQWAGGNQDPIFLRDLFATGESPEKKKGGRNRSRYSNTEFDKVVQEAVDAPDKAKAKELYAKAQSIVANELPYFTLWYPSNMVIATKRIGNININPSGDWNFVKDLTVN
jgi:peptide/nickel transport system substrate-binding protein